LLQNDISRTARLSEIIPGKVDSLDTKYHYVGSNMNNFNSWGDALSLKLNDNEQEDNVPEMRRETLSKNIPILQPSGVFSNIAGKEGEAMKQELSHFKIKYNYHLAMMQEKIRSEIPGSFQNNPNNLNIATKPCNRMLKIDADLFKGSDIHQESIWRML
jgi:hypothetical protein